MTTSRHCELCGLPMHGGQGHCHLTCCAKRGGRQPVSNSVRVDKNTDEARNVCAHCWIDDKRADAA